MKFPASDGQPLPAMHHVGMVVRDAADAADRFSRVGGFKASQPVDLEYTDATVGGVRATFAARYVFVEAGPTLIELIQPLSEHSPYTRFLDTQGEGIHHFGFFVENLDARIDALRETSDTDPVVVTASIPGHGRFVYISDLTPGPLIELIDSSTPEDAM